MHTDSQYLRDGVTAWMGNWKRNGWRTRDRKPVKNDDLWRRLDEATQRHEIDWRWVRGHAGDPMNERADELARRGMAPFLPVGPRAKAADIENIGHGTSAVRAASRLGPIATARRLRATPQGPKAFLESCPRKFLHFGLYALPTTTGPCKRSPQ